MKAYTVYQPYAYATVAGLKHYETRPRRTNIRGRVAVHAGRLDEVHATKSLSNPVEEIVNTLSERERVLGDYSPGRFAWVIQNPVMFDEPFPARGKQGWWEWEGAK